MSFGGKSFKREELRIKQELQNLTRQSKNEFAGLNNDDKSQLLESSSKTSLSQRSQATKRNPTKKTTKNKRPITRNLDEQNNDSDVEIPPPSPSIDLGLELRSTTPDSEIVTKTAQEAVLQDSVGVHRRTTELISRSTAASIRSKVDLSVVMYGKGFGEENTNAKQKEKKSTVKPQSARPGSRPKTPQKAPQPEGVPAKKPAIIGSQSTAVAVQLTPRPAPKQRPSSRAGSAQGSVKSRASSVKDEDILHPTTPTLLNEREADIVNTAEDETDIREEEEGLEVNQSCEDGVNIHDDGGLGNEFSSVEIAVDYEGSEAVNENTEWGDAEPDEENQVENTEKDLKDIKISLSAHDVEGVKTEGKAESGEDSPINRIHSEILELTRRISMPEAGILNLIRATEEAENEAKRQNEASAAASSPSKESLLLRAMAEHGSSEFSIQGALRSLSSRDTKQASASPSKSPAIGSKAKLQSDEGGKTSVAEKESLSTSPKKERTITVNSEMTVPGDMNVKSQTTEELPLTAGKGTETRRSEVTDRDMLASQSLTLLTRQGLASQKTMTNEQAMECLLLPSEVVPEDIISITGQQVEISSKQWPAPADGPGLPLQDLSRQWIDLKQEKSVMFLDSWQVKEAEKENKPVKTHNIHHFCTMPSRVELPPHLCKLTRDEHTRDKFHRGTEKPMDVNFKILEEEPEVDEAKEEETESDEKSVKLGKTEERRWSVVAQKILMEALVAGDSDETLNRLKKALDSLFSSEQGESLDIVGVKMELKDDTSRLYWTPAPPKMNLAPATIKTQLYPDYQGASLLQESLGADLRTVTGLDSDDNDETEADLDDEDVKARNRVLSRMHESMTDLRKLVADTQVQRPKTDIGGMVDGLNLQTGEIDGRDEQVASPSRFISVLDKRRQEIKQQDDREEKDFEQDEDEESTTLQKEQDKGSNIFRSVSHPLLSVGDKVLKVSAGYDISMNELNYQRDQVAAIKDKQQEKDENEDMELPQEKPFSATTVTSRTEHSTIMDLQGTPHEFDTDEGRTDAGDSMSIQTGTTGPTSRRKHPQRKIRKKTQKELEREQAIREFLNQPARKISRRKSITDIRNLEREETLLQRTESISTRSELSRVNSQPARLDFDGIMKNEFTGSDEALFDEVRERTWYVWFDEVYPPTPAVPEIKFDLQSLTSPRPHTQSKSSGVVIDNSILEDIQVIEPEIRSSDQELYKALQEEVVRLTDLLETTQKTESSAIFLCRRGAVFRKLGYLKKAWDDLNRSIELEPKLLDAYWHRHLLHLLQDNRKSALDDLSFIIKHSSNQARAFRSRAELYRQENDATMAIVNYSQAIKLNPNDAETYYQRAAMFKMRGDMILALEDYKIAAKLLPSKTDAMFEIGLFRFNNQNWTAALRDFTELLQQDPEDSKAYTYRARAHAKMGNFEAALKDLAAAVHYDPLNAVAFYHRGCLLRRVHPKRALQDLSVSLLLDNSEENVKAFLHRGILYTDLKRWEDAVPDFEAALQLDSELASAHVNIGLIYITKYSNYHKAVRRYTAAIHVDPTYIRAYICRAEAYHKLHMIQDAILDYTRVIHMRPDISDYHMARGKLLLEQNKLELASFHVRQAADLNRGLGASATQQAVVQSFLRNFDQAIEVLERATRVKPVAPLFILLGKTNMKAKRFENAISSFERAIEIMTPWNPKVEMPIEAASVHFLIGMCQSELGRRLGALDAFNNAIRVNPDYAEAFYQRGLTKMKLKHAKGIHDFNRALAINPTLFQAFLSRAAYYGMKGRFSKGIMSCNEAIKLQPRSVRAYLYRGALKYNIKAYSLAVKDLTEAVAIDCKCSLAYFNRAVCYHEMRFFQKALMDYGTVMLLEDTPNIKVLQNRGLLYYEIDDMENALQDFLAAAKVSPKNPHIRHTLGLCYHRLNRLEEAVSSYNDALRIDPFFVEAYNGRGNALMDFGHEDGTVLGRHDYLKALHMDPLCLSARVNLGYNLQVEGKFQAAWSQFSAAITIDSACQSALEGRAVVNLQMGNTFGAFVDMNDAIKISKTAELLTNRGVVQQFMGDFVNAIRDYQAAVKTDPSYALAYYNAANVYFRQRQFKQALSYYDKALSWYAEDESAVLNRAITKVMMKDSRGAIQDFNRAVELNPYAAHVYFNRANLYASLRKYKESEDDYTRALSLKPGDALVYKRRADVFGKQGKKAAAIEDYKRAIIIQTRKQ
ncbi:hypothetical protein ACROYT_G036906 [Oculina patagonica]